jgi:hypothetical protein
MAIFLISGGLFKKIRAAKIMVAVPWLLNDVGG